MPLPLEQHARQVLLENDRGLLFHEAIKRGWARFEEQYPDRHRWARKATSRAVVWESIMSELAGVVADDAGLKIVSHRDTRSIIAEDEFLFRLKHASPALATSNYPTSEAVKFDDHDIDLYGFNGLQRIRLCYVLDQFENGVVWTGASAQSRGALLWKIQLSDFGVEPETQTLPLSEPEIDPAKVLKLKGDQKPGRQKGEG